MKKKVIFNYLFYFAFSQKVKSNQAKPKTYRSAPTCSKKRKKKSGTKTYILRYFISFLKIVFQFYLFLLFCIK